MDEMEFENWLTFWFDQLFTIRGVAYVEGNNLSAMLAEDLRQAGFKITKESNEQQAKN